MAYSELVRPILGYASPIWDPDRIIFREELEKVQNRAARLAFMRTEFLCFSVLRVTSGPRLKLADRKSALTAPSPHLPTPPPPTHTHTHPVVYSTDRSKAVVPVLILLFVALWFILREDLFYVLPYVILFLCFSILLALRLPRLGKRQLVLVLFVRLYNLRLFGFVNFLKLLVSEKGCGLWLRHSLGWESFYKRPKGNKLICLFTGLKGRPSIPCDYLQPPNRCSRNQHPMAYQVPYARTDIYKNSFLECIPCIYNILYWKFCGLCR